jgi:hypothetical protein
MAVRIASRSDDSVTQTGSPSQRVIPKLISNHLQAAHPQNYSVFRFRLYRLSRAWQGSGHRAGQLLFSPLHSAAESHVSGAMRDLPDSLPFAWFTPVGVNGIRSRGS